MDLDQALKHYFGFESFRSGQRQVIERVLARKDTLAVLPTGLGKSLCYQLPAQLLDGITLVISPLIALMRDQVDALRRRGFKNATFLNSSLDPATQGSRYDAIEDGYYKLVYVAPERCDSPRFQAMLGKAKVDLLVIDEAHCISQWGHDFRPHYRTLLKRLPELQDSAILAMTATATPEVQKDIIAVLGREMERVVADFNRPNLFFEVVEVDNRAEKETRLLSLVGEGEGPAIVYTSTRKEAESACGLLQSEGVSAVVYHAGLSTAERSEAQHLFQQDKRRVIVATVAFGMGIDKPDVRRVIHYNIPGSLEGYYQEAGRAGRDGLPAICTLFFSNQDLGVQEFLLSNSYPDHTSVYQVYDILLGANPLPVAPAEIAKSSELPEMAVKSSLQLMYEQQHVAVNRDGKYTVTRSEIARPGINFRPLLERGRRARQRLDTMIAYATADTCRRASILKYFGQKYDPPCPACDVCSPAPAEADTEEASPRSNRVARIILEAVQEFGGRLGRTMISETLTGSRRRLLLDRKLDESDAYLKLKVYGKDKALQWLDELIDRKLVATTHGKYPLVYITPRGRKALENESLIPLKGLGPTQPVSRPATAENSLQASASVGTPSIAAEPESPDVGRLRLDVEMWRQGGPAPDTELLLSMLDRDDIRQRQNDLVVFINVLGELGFEAVGPTLKRMLAENLEPSSPANVLYALCNSAGRVGATDAAPELIRLLDDERTMVRTAAVRAAGRLRLHEAREKLEAMAKTDKATSVRLAARAAASLIASTNGAEAG